MSALRITLILTAALSARADVIIADPHMPACRYTGPDNRLPLGNERFTVSATSHAAGGAPGAYRDMRFNFGTAPGTGFITSNAVVDFHTTGRWNPAQQGAITGVSYYLDAQAASLKERNTLSLIFALRQGGTVYYNFSYNILNGNWTTAERTALPQTAFNSTGYSTGPQPDFSEKGGVIEFGYVGVPVKWANTPDFHLNVDNFCVAVNEGPQRCPAALSFAETLATRGCHSGRHSKSSADAGEATGLTPIDSYTNPRP